MDMIKGSRDQGFKGKLTLRSVLLAFSVAALAFVHSAFANAGFDWKGTGGAVVVPANTKAVVLDEDIADIENLTSISLADKTSQMEFQNTQPITLKAAITGAGGGGSSKPHIIMSASTGHVSFNGQVFLTAGNTYYTLGNCTVNAKFGGNANYYYVTAVDGCTVTYSETAQIVRRYLAYFYGPGTHRFECARVPYGTDTFAQFNFTTAKIQLTKENSTADGAFFFDAGGVLDLVGVNQAIPAVKGGSDVAKEFFSVVTVKSAEPATLTFNQSVTNAYQRAEWNSSVIFTDKVSLTYAGNQTYCLLNGTSTTSGDLRIANGVFKLTGNSLWAGPRVYVTGGKLVADSAVGPFGAQTVVSVSDSGVLEIPDGKAVGVAKLVIAGDEIDLSGGGKSIAELKSLQGGKYAPYLSGSTGRLMAPSDFYLDAVNGADDAEHDGLSEATAMRTFAGLMNKYSALAAGSSVFFLPGTYDAGEMAVAGLPGKFRVAVPASVRLVARDGRDKTFIRGAQSTTPVKDKRGCGPDAISCVYLGPTASISGFTLENGCSYMQADGSNPANGAGVYAAGSSSCVYDCRIQNCQSANIAAGYLGKYFRTIFLNNHACANYSAHLREAYAYNCLSVNSDEVNGQFSTMMAVQSCTFAGKTKAMHNVTVPVDNCIFSDVLPAGNDKGSPTFRHCLWTTAPSVGKVGEGCKLVTVAELALDAEYCPATASVAVDSGAFDLYSAAMPETEAGFDLYRVQRVMNGQMDVGAAEHDWRPDFSHTLAADGSVVVQAVGPRTTMNGDATGVVIASNETMTASWKKSPFDVTTFRFVAVPADGATLFVYTNGTLCTTVTEAQTVSFDGVDTVDMRFVAEGAVNISDFRNGVVAVIDAPLGGVSIEGATNGVNYVTDKPLTFTIRPKCDSYDQYSTGFRSNGVDYVWADFPDGFTHTVKDASSEIVVNIVYTAPGSLEEWYVDPDGSDTANYGRVPSNPLKTLAKAASLARSGQTIHAAAGVYDQGTMYCSAEATAKGYYRVVLPDGVALESDEGAEKTFIVGAKAEPASARIALDGCGTNSVRGVFMNNYAALRGFTVTGCYGYCYVNTSGAADGEYGGGIRCKSSAVGTTASAVGRIYDCIVSNNYAWGGAGAHCGCFVRCQFLNNRSYLGYRVGFTGTPGYAIDCYFKGQTSDQTVQAHVTDINAAVNCTFMGSICGVRSAGSAVQCYNCVFESSPSQSNVAGAGFYNCLATALPTSCPETWTAAGRNNKVVSADQLALDPVTHAPAANNLAPVDSAIAWGYYTNKVSSLIAEAEYAKDLNGNQRVYNDALDIGAAEYDWRPDFSLVLSSDGKVRVGDMGPLVTTNESQTAVRVPNDQVMVLACSGKKGSRWIFEVRMPGTPDEDALTVICGGVPLKPINRADGVWRYSCPMLGERAELSIANTGADYADVLSFHNEMGMYVVFD